jgi:hypothetical protein
MAFPTDIRGKINVALNYKEEGNGLFKEGKYQKAFRKYAHCFAFTKGIVESVLFTCLNLKVA